MERQDYIRIKCPGCKFRCSGEVTYKDEDISELDGFMCENGKRLARENHSRENA